MGPGKGIDADCLAQHHIAYYTHASYHSESRFWLFQAIEASIHTAMALTLLAFSVWWIRKRIS